MRAFFSILLFCALAIAYTDTNARSAVDSLRSSAGDMAVIAYDVQGVDDVVTVKFSQPKKRLGPRNSNLYGKKLDKLVVVFFDRAGRYEDVTFTGETPKAIMLPDNVSFERSQEGYYFFFESDMPPMLTFRVPTGSSLDMKLPMFLAFQEHRKAYRLISYLGDLRIRSGLEKRQNAELSQQKTQTVTKTIEIDADNGAMTQVLDCIGNIERALVNLTALPVSESLEYDIKRLRDWQYTVTDPNLKRRISETLDSYEQKKQELTRASEQRQIAIEREKQEKAEQQARQLREEENARLEEQRQESEIAKKRTVWMAICGVLLAILAFVGNQVMQSVRAKRNQKDMLKMQQDISKRVEQEAKRRAGNAIRSQTRKTVNSGKQKVKDTLKKNVGGKAGNGKQKSFSI